MRIFVLNLTILLLATLFFLCCTGYAFETEILNKDAECFHLVLDTCQSVPFLYLLQTDRHKMPGPVSPTGTMSLLKHPVGKSLLSSTVTDCGVCSRPWQLMALRKAESVLFVTSNHCISLESSSCLTCGRILGV
jgi:hypothetical protein